MPSWSSFPVYGKGEYANKANQNTTQHSTNTRTLPNSWYCAVSSNVVCSYSKTLQAMLVLCCLSFAVLPCIALCCAACGGLSLGPVLLSCCPVLFLVFGLSCLVLILFCTGFVLSCRGFVLSISFSCLVFLGYFVFFSS